MTSRCPAHFYFDKLLRTCHHCLLLCHKSRLPAECQDTCSRHATTSATIVAESLSDSQASGMENTLYIVLTIGISLAVFVALAFLIYRRVSRRQETGQPPRSVEMQPMKSTVVNFIPTNKSTFGQGYSQVMTTTAPVSETGSPENTSLMVTNYN